MWRRKKFIIIAVLVAVMLAGSIGGVVLANGDESQPETSYGTLLDKACEIYEQKTGVAIDQEALKDAFAEAQSEMQIEALRDRLQDRVNEGEITQSEADQYLEWWQSKPDVSFGFGLRGGGFRGMGGPLGWGGRCFPAE